MKDLTWTPFFAIFYREIRRFFKVIFQTVATPLISTTLYLLIFGVSIGKEISDIQNVSYLGFLIPGLVMMAILRNAFDNASGSIITAKFTGELEGLKMAPLSPNQIIFGIGFASVVRGWIVGALTWLIGLIFMNATEQPLPLPPQLSVLILFFLMGGLAFACLGITTTMFAKNIEEISAVNTFLLVPLIYLGGVFFSLEQLHPIWQTISRFNPLLYFVNGVRFGMLGISDLDPVFCFIVSLATTFLFYLAAVWGVKKGSYQSW